MDTSQSWREQAQPERWAQLQTPAPRMSITAVKAAPIRRYLYTEHVEACYLCHLADAFSDQFLPLLLRHEELQFTK